MTLNVINTLYRTTETTLTLKFNDTVVFRRETTKVPSALWKCLTNPSTKFMDASAKSTREEVKINNFLLFCLSLRNHCFTSSLQGYK